MIDIKKETAKRLEEQGIPSDITFRLFSVGLIPEHQARRFLIVDDYKNARPVFGERNHLKDKIADEFCVSSATVKLFISKGF